MTTPLNVYIPYEDFINAQQDSAKLASIVSILETEFPDDTCQLIAIKSILGIEEKEEEPDEPDTPSDPIDPDPGTTEPEPPTSGDPVDPEPSEPVDP